MKCKASMVIMLVVILLALSALACGNDTAQLTPNPACHEEIRVTYMLKGTEIVPVYSRVVVCDDGE